MAKITIQIEFPELSERDLRDLVAARDYTDDDDPIDPKYVRATHVLQLLDEVGIDSAHVILLDQIEE